MKRAALALALVTASTGVASAGYLGLGIGTAPAVSADDLQNKLIEDGRSGRLLVGYSFGRFALEGAVGKYGLVMGINNSRGTVPYDVYQAQVAGKVNLPLGDGFEAFGRLGYQKQWFSTDVQKLDVEGSGLLLGAGFEYRFPTGIGAMSVFVDYQYSRADVQGDNFKFGSTNVRMWTLGATIGF